MNALFSPSAIVLIGFIALIAFAAASFLADNWCRKNILLPDREGGHRQPEDFASDAAGEAMMAAEFERIRKAHEARRATRETAR